MLSRFHSRVVYHVSERDTGLDYEILPLHLLAEVSGLYSTTSSQLYLAIAL
jgi:hypothetical protein